MENSKLLSVPRKKCNKEYIRYLLYTLLSTPFIRKLLRIANSQPPASKHDKPNSRTPSMCAGGGHGPLVTYNFCMIPHILTMTFGLLGCTRNMHSSLNVVLIWTVHTHIYKYYLLNSVPDQTAPVRGPPSSEKQLKIRRRINKKGRSTG